MAKNAFAPVTPGEMLKEEILVEYGLSQSHLAKAVVFRQIASPRLSTIGGALPPIPTSIKFVLRQSPDFWMNLQTHYDL